MPAVQMRMPMSRDFEDITLYGPNERHEKEWNRQRNSQTPEDSSFHSRGDPHYSMASASSAVSTPTLASDASSFRSSVSSHSSPSLPQFAAPGMPPMAPPNGLKIHTQEPTILDPQGKPIPNNIAPAQIAGYGRRRSVPALVDTTSMASLTIKAQSGTKSRKQRELDFEADQDDDIWPGDSLMFNVPMSPALYAQQRMKHYQINSVPARSDHSSTPMQLKQQPQHSQFPQHHRVDPRSNLECSVPPALPRQGYRGSTPSLPSHFPSPLQQQVHSSTVPKRSSGLRNSLPAINEGSSNHRNSRSTSSAGSDPQNQVKDDEFGEEAEKNGQDECKRAPVPYSRDEESEASAAQDAFYSKQPGYAPPSFIPSSDDSFISSDLPALLARNSTGSGGNTSINGLDPDASDLTLEFFQLEEDKRHRNSQNIDVSLNSITSLAMSENENSPLPSPSLASCRGSEDDARSGSSGSGLDSRRSSLTRPENLPPKDPEEERKHLREYEKLLKDAAVAEKKKQQKREEEAKKRAQQAKLDHTTWSNWLAKGQRYSLSSDLKWRGLPDKLRGTIWSLKLGNRENNKTNPPFQRRHNYHHIETEIVEDSERIWPGCAIFGKGRPFHEPLINVVQQFLGIRKEVPYSFGVTGIAALLLLQLSDAESVRAMLVLLEPGTLTHAVLTGNERLASANYVSFNKVFQAKFPQLSQHFTKVGLTTTELLNPLIAGMFTTVLPTPECATRILDVFIFEGDSFLLRAALGLIMINEAYLYESKQDILLGIQSPRVSTEDALMTAIRDVTRK